MNIDHPFHLDQFGRTATTDDDDHIRDLIEQVLFTNPGERVNRPDFGAGLLQLVFAGNSAELANSVQFVIQSSLQRWVTDLVEVHGVEVTSEEGTIHVTVEYRVRRTNERATAQFERAV